MAKFVCGLVICLFVAGCPSTGALYLTESEAQELVVNFEAAVEVQQLLSEFVFAAGRGELDLTGVAYVAPALENNWVGMLTFADRAFPFGVGDLTITFTASGDAGPVDPYVVDLTGHDQVTVDATVLFSGMSMIGESVMASADFTIATTTNDPDNAVTVVNGDFDINHDGYEVALDAIDLALTLDLVLGEISNVLGRLDGEVDIPDFAFDASFSINGLGDSVSIDIDVVATTIQYALDLEDLF